MEDAGILFTGWVFHETYDSEEGSYKSPEESGRSNSYTIYSGIFNI